MDAVMRGLHWPMYFTSRGERGGARARAGDTLFARITPCLENGKVAQIQVSVERCGGSTEFIVLRVGPELLPDYLYVWATASSTRLAAETLMTGTTGRQRLSPQDMAALPMSVPPLAEQRRIVDLVAAVDAAIRTAGEYAAAAAGATRAYLDECFGAPTAESPPLGDLARLGSGPSWKASDEFSKPGVGTTPVIGIPNTPNGQRLVDLAQRKHVRGLPPSVRRLTPDSLVMIRTNGNRRRIGNIYRVPDAGAGHAYSAFQIGIFPEERRDAPYLFWLLSSPSVQRRISDAASGSTGLGNIAVSWLNRLEVPWPPEADRMRLCRAADGLQGVCDAINIVQRRFEILRSGLLTELLSGDHEVPASYDRFLDGAA
jgi:hypothetical protein